MDPRYPQPRWRVVVDGVNITPHIAPRLMSLGITSCRAEHADQLDLSISDHDGRFALPRTGITVQVALGWDTTGLTDMGTFVVDEVEHAGTPDHVTLRARSLHIAAMVRQKRDQSWHNLTVGALVAALARRNGLTPRCADSLASIHITHIDQTRESDMNILSRIGKLWDAVATVKAGCLLFAPVGSGASATGASLPQITLVRADGDQHRYHAADRDAYTGVQAYWHDTHGAQKRAAIAGTEQTLKTLTPIYANAGDALRAAKAEWQRIQRGAATFALTLARGRADVYPEMPVRVSGFRPPIDAIGWLVKQVEHRLDDSGFTTSIECETADAPAPALDGGEG